MSSTTETNKATKQVTVRGHNLNLIRYDIRDFSPYLKYGELDTNSVGSRSVGLSLNEGSPLYYMTPLLYCPFDLSVMTNPATGDRPASKSYRVTTSLTGYNDPNHDNHHKAVEYFDMISALDNDVKRKAIDNSLPWLKQKNTGKPDFNEVIDALFNPTFKLSVDKETQEPDGKYPPSQTFAILYYDDKFETEAYDQDGNPVNITEALVKGCRIKGLVMAQKVTFPQGKFGVRHVLLRLKIWSPNGHSGKTIVVDDSDDEE
jgi:hypothetical protein